MSSPAVQLVACVSLPAAAAASALAMAQLRRAAVARVNQQAERLLVVRAVSALDGDCGCIILCDLTSLCTQY